MKKQCGFSMRKYSFLERTVTSWMNVQFIYGLIVVLLVVQLYLIPNNDVDIYVGMVGNITG